MRGKMLIPDLQTYVLAGNIRLMHSYTVAATLWISAETLKRLLITPAAPQVISHSFSQQLLSSANQERMLPCTVSFYRTRQSLLE